MTDNQRVTKWLKDNTNLAWTRTGGDEPPVVLDRVFINRSEGYEVRDFILKYYDICGLKHSEENYSISLDKIMDYKKGQKVKSQDLLDYLKNELKK